MPQEPLTPNTGKPHTALPAKRRALVAATIAVTFMALAILAVAAHSTSHSRRDVGEENEVAHTLTSGARCGAERWPVKTLTDPAARSVNFQPQASTITALTQTQPPAGEPTDRQPEEQISYRIHANLLAFKQEADSDIHLVVSEPGNPAVTMIVEFPLLACTYGAQHRYAMLKARQAIEHACGPASNRFTSLTGTANISGVLFYDRIHGQYGVAPNGVEIHPAFGFKLTNGVCR